MTVAQRSRAADMLSRKGQTVTITATTGGTHNVATGKPSGGSSYNKSAKAVVLPLSPFRKAQGENIKQGDEQMLLAGLDTTGAALPQPPVNAVVMLADGSKRTLIAIDRLDPDGAGSILYDCICRGNA